MRLFTIIVFGFFPATVSSQSWQLIKEIKRSGIESYALDQVGNIYVSNAQGEVIKYSKDGELMVEYAPQQVASIHEIIAISQFKISLFYKDLQEFVILNRYMSSPITYRLSDFGLGYIEDVAPNFQQSLWVLDISDFALKLIDLREDRLLEEKSLAQVLDQNLAKITAFHSHQNRMYVVDQSSGVHVFDNIGNYLFKLMVHAPHDVGFEKDYMYYKKNGALHLIHLYDGENLILPITNLKIEKLRYLDERLVAITAQGFNIYQYLSGQ